MLGAPPAFVLSQDQTLNSLVSYHGLPCYNLRLRSPSLDSLLSYFLVELNRVRFISSRYFLTLFNFQDPFAALSDNPLPRSDSIIISLCRPFVKHFFGFFRSSFKLRFPSCFPSVTALLLYRVSSPLSTLFFRFSEEIFFLFLNRFYSFISHR